VDYTQLHSKNLGDGGPVSDNTMDADVDATTYNALQLPGAKRGDDGSRSTGKMEIRTMQVAFASTGREWGVISEEGLHIYSLDDDMIFDPIALNEAITPASVEVKLSSGQYGLALRMALHLNEGNIIQTVLEQIPYKAIASVVRSVHQEHHLERLLQMIGKMVEESPHVEFYIQWCLELLQTHGMYIDRNRKQFLRALRAMHKAVTTKRDDVNNLCNENKYTLDFLEDHATLFQQINSEPKAEQLLL
jgi:periodic tryptophan protein 2